MMLRSIAHRIRDFGVRAASQRPFKPIETPAPRIILVRPDHFGDLLMLQPALRYIQDHATDHDIVLMTGPWNESIARHIAPEIETMTWQFPGFDRSNQDRSPLDPYREVGNAARAVRDLKPQAIILLRDDHWWGALMSYEAGVPLRIGYDEPRMNSLLTHPVSIPHEHYVSQNLRLTRTTLTLLGYSLPDPMRAEQPKRLSWPVDSESESEVRRLLAEIEEGNRIFAVHPGTGAGVKRWPARRWAQVIDLIHERTGAKAVLTGAAAEAKICGEIASEAQCRPHNLAGRTTLFSLGEVLRAVDLVLGVDSGPLHLATAVDTPSIHLYGPSDRVRYGPWGDEADHVVVSSGLSCSSCGDLSPERGEGCGCMTAITVPDVAELAIERLQDVQ